MDINALSPHILDKLNVVVTDNNNVITFVSPSYAKLLGYDVEELIGKKRAEKLYNYLLAK